MSLVITLVLLALLIVSILSMPVFGRLPTNGRLARIQTAPNYQGKEVKNLLPTPMKPEGVSYGNMLYQFFFVKHPNRVPPFVLPAVKPDYTHSSIPKLIWYGHSTYMIQSGGKNILVDPVFSKRASPFDFIGSKAFPGSDFTSLEELPELDIVLITHDHYDHLDYSVIKQLKYKSCLFVTSLGVGAHLQYWGIAAERIIEVAWHESVVPLKDIRFTAVPARHFSGRKFKRNQTFWSAFVLELNGAKLYLGGDSGYDDTFAKIGGEYGPFDLAILECGQYNTMWPLIHMFPEQTVQAAIDLGAKALMPVHWGKFSLAMHAWDEPITRAKTAADTAKLPLITPSLGASVILGNDFGVNNWWRKQ